MSEKPWFCYLLRTLEGSPQTYVGATVDVDRRLRQHNSEIKGGARRTTALSSRAPAWKRVCHVSGFANQVDALRFEWHWKHRSRKRKEDPVRRRLLALQELLMEEGWMEMEVHWEEGECPTL